MRKIILASASPRRRQLLKQLGLEFVVDASNIEEVLNPRLGSRRQVEELSVQKAEAVRGKYRDAVVIAADSMVSIEGELLGKPKNIAEAKRMLRRLSGREHSVVTGFTILDMRSGKMITKSSETKVFFKKLSEREIEGYVKVEKVLDKAGAYGIQGMGAVLIDRIEGDYFGMVGLSLRLVGEELRKFGVMVLGE